MVLLMEISLKLGSKIRKAHYFMTKTLCLTQEIIL